MNTPRQSPEEILEALRLPLMEKLAQYPDFGSVGFDLTFHQGRVTKTEWRFQEKVALANAAEEINRVPLATRTAAVSRRRPGTNQ